MTLHTVGAGMVDPLGADTRGPVIVAFLVFIGVSLLWIFTLVAAQEDHPERLYVADRSLSPVFNGFAMAGEQISVITLLAIPGAIALFGYDGFAAAINGVIAVGVLLLLSQKIRDSGRYTLGDLFALRVSGRAPRIAATLVTLTIAIPILMIQLRAAGISTALLIGRPTYGVQVLCTVAMGCLVACFAGVADLKGTSVMHVVKVPVTLTTLAAVTLLALRKFEWDPGDLLAAAVNRSVAPHDYLSPGLWPYTTGLGPLNAAGDHIVLILGTAVMPHLILRVSASATGRGARRSLSIATGLVSGFILLLIATGFAAAAVVGSSAIGAIDANGTASPILLAAAVLPGSSAAHTLLIVVVACGAFLTVLTTVSSVAFAAAVSFARDVFAGGKRPRTEAEEVRALRTTVVLLCAGGLSLAAATHRLPVEFLLTFSMSVAASCAFPALIYSFYWSTFNRRGLLWSVYGGLLVCTILTVFSPAVSGTASSLWPEGGFNWYPLHNPGLVSVPAAFILGWLGSTGPRSSGSVREADPTGTHPAR
ncbi:sodium:solute symporter family transporter [Streptomyces vinaceus]|uniref:sodium:solute symporter family transporter n=1 Tax=Streptomyces vinaceus TaxID=1960 RepID=UPI00368A2011